MSSRQGQAGDWQKRVNHYLTAWPCVPVHFCPGWKLQAAPAVLCWHLVEAVILRGPQEYPVSKVIFSECPSDLQREGHARTLNTWDPCFRPVVTSMVLTEADAL